MRKNSLIGILTLALCFTGCITDVKVSVDFDYDDFVSEQEAWNASKPANYQFHYESQSDGYSTWVKTLIVVENGEFVSQTPDEEYTEAHKGLTIDDIYESVQNAYLRYDGATVKSNEDYLKSIDVEWDRENHIPLKVIMRYYVPPMLADAASRWERTISGFTPTE